jgi:hypothetical protein
MQAAVKTLNNNTSLLYRELLFVTILADSVRNLSSSHGNSLISGNENRNLPMRLNRRPINWYDAFIIRDTRVAQL